MNSEDVSLAEREEVVNKLAEEITSQTKNIDELKGKLETMKIKMREKEAEWSAQPEDVRAEPSKIKMHFERVCKMGETQTKMKEYVFCFCFKFFCFNYLLDVRLIQLFGAR